MISVIQTLINNCFKTISDENKTIVLLIILVYCFVTFLLQLSLYTIYKRTCHIYNNYKSSMTKINLFIIKKGHQYMSVNNYEMCLLLEIMLSTVPVIV